MSRIAAYFSGKCVSSSLISITSAVVFLVLDILDVIMCFVFRFLDELIDGQPSPCYCLERERKEYSIGESGLSESLYGRKNAFTKMLLRSKKEPFCVEKKKRRWSDCGCESCLSWINNGSDFKLHFVVREPQRDKLKNNDQERTVQNVIFVHGFISSSSLWTETVFPNLSENSKQNYRLFAVDLLGFGGSPKPMDCLYTLNDHLEMIKKSVIIPFKLKSFHLVAHSMGCVIALALAAKYSESVKSITLIAPPYFSSSKGDVSSEALRKLAARRVWPPLLFGSAFMSWNEHLSRCVCFFVCRNHRTWEWVLKLLTRRDLHFWITDSTRHTHHSAWHTMHNVVCGGMKFLDKYLEVLTRARVKIYVGQGSKDEIVPVECSFNMKMKAPQIIDLHIILNANHNSFILGRPQDFTRNLERFWASIH